MLCRMQNKFRDHTATNGDRLQEGMKRSNKDFHDDTNNLFDCTAFTRVQMGFCTSCGVGFVSNSSFLLLNEIVENTYYKT